MQHNYYKFCHLFTSWIVIKNNNFKRFQTSVKADCDVAIRFAKFLGLEEEGLMKNYGPDGADFYRFARILK